jgi:hypothetical protein
MTIEGALVAAAGIVLGTLAALATLLPFDKAIGELTRLLALLHAASSAQIRGLTASRVDGRARRARLPDSGLGSGFGFVSQRSGWCAGSATIRRRR